MAAPLCHSFPLTLCPAWHRLSVGLTCSSPPSLLSSPLPHSFLLIPPLVHRLGSVFHLFCRPTPCVRGWAGHGWFQTARRTHRWACSRLEPALAGLGHRSLLSRDPETELRLTQIYSDITKDATEWEKGGKKNQADCCKTCLQRCSFVS